MSKIQIHNSVKIIVSVFCAILLASCAPSNPLWGKWTDGTGNNLVLSSDMNFNAKIISEEIPFIYNGTYSIMHNSLFFSLNDGRTVIAEWDIRGQIMYLNWPSPNYEDQNIKLALFLTGK